MRIALSLLLSASGLLVCAPSSAQQHPLPEEIWELFDASRSDSMCEPDESELVLFERLFSATLDKEHRLSSLQSQWEALGFDIRAVGAHHVVIAEQAGQRCGRGFYVIDRDARSGLFVQAPHRLDDRSTGQLALDFLAAGAAAVGISTVRRDLVDLAHTDSCALSSATAAFARSTPDGTVLQLHGYAATAHAELSPFDGVLSSSTSTRPSPHLGMEQRCLAAHAGIRLAVFPTDTSELGGTTNSQARVARRHDLRFRHLELDEATRARLRRDDALIAPLVTCFTEERE